jgi:hypothetical protein
VIDCQDLNGRAANVGQAHQPIFLPAKVIDPFILAWIEQTSRGSGRRIDAGDVRTFVPVAAAAGQSQILHDALAAVLPFDDMVRDVTKLRQRFGKLAVLTQSSRAIMDLLMQGLVHDRYAAES